jgi:N-acetylmuramoyl-L-alanine amidase
MSIIHPPKPHLLVVIVGCLLWNLPFAGFAAVPPSSHDDHDHRDESLSFSPSDVLGGWLHNAPVPRVAQQLRPSGSAQGQGVVAGSPYRAIVNGIDFSDGQLIIKSNRPLRVKNQFVLKGPNRLVIDLDNAVLADRSLLGTRTFANPNISQVRLGQFDEDTVRLTIEASQPYRLSVTKPEDNVLIVDSQVANNPTALAAVPVPTSPTGAPITTGRLDNIYLDSPSGLTQIRVHTSAPMRQKLSRNGDVLSIDMDNIAANPGIIRYNQREFPTIRKMWIEPNGSGCRINIKLTDGSAGMNTALLSAKKILQIDLGSPVMLGGGLAPVPLPKLPSGGAMRVVVDAGHGGKDAGANRMGINEKDLNLTVAHKLRQALEARGVSVSMTRSTDVFLPLPEITNITNSIMPDVFVSVHTNSSTNPDITGIETYFYTNQSIPLANRVHRQLTSRINTQDRGVRQARFYVIHHTQVPAILCEMGYISNSDERYSLTTEGRQNQTADAIADGVVDYLRSRSMANTETNLDGSLARNGLQPLVIDPMTDADKQDLTADNIPTAEDTQKPLADTASATPATAEPVKQ